MKWIKASERLPKNPGRYFVKVGRQSIPDNGDKNQVATFTSHKEWYLENHHHSRDFYYISPDEWLDERGDAIPFDKLGGNDPAWPFLIKRLDEKNIQLENSADYLAVLQAMNEYLAGATNHPLPEIAFKEPISFILNHAMRYCNDEQRGILAGKLLRRSDPDESNVGYTTVDDSSEPPVAKEQGGEEASITCVFCEMPCEPAPTKRGWSSVRYGKGLHFDCAGKVVDQGNIIGMKELEELGKDPTT